MEDEIHGIIIYKWGHFEKISVIQNGQRSDEENMKNEMKFKNQVYRCTIIGILKRTSMPSAQKWQILLFVLRVNLLEW